MTDIDQLAHELAEAKALEDSARQARILVEGKIIEALGVKDEGSTTFKGLKYKITTTGKISRSLDVGTWDAIKNHVPAEFWPVTMKPEIDTKGLKWLKENQAAIYTTVCQAISAKPAKPAVSFEELKNGD